MCTGRRSFAVVTGVVWLTRPPAPVLTPSGTEPAPSEPPSIRKSARPALFPRMLSSSKDRTTLSYPYNEHLAEGSALKGLINAG